jgi:DNA mismatch endonuclease, patch repair protein
MSRWPGNAQRERTTFGGLSRSQLMSRVRSTGNKTTEQRLALLLRHFALHGWRRQQALPGHPDFVWRGAKVAVFVDGCFWHGHNCGKNITPQTNAKAWQEKLQRNRQRDRRITRVLSRDGWRVVRIWECLLLRKPDRCVEKIRRALITLD